MMEDEFLDLDLTFGSVEPVAGNLLPHRADGYRSSTADTRYDQLDPEFKRLLAKCGITKGSLRRMARQLIDETEDLK